MSANFFTNAKTAINTTWSSLHTLSESTDRLAASSNESHLNELEGKVQEAINNIFQEIRQSRNDLDQGAITFKTAQGLSKSFTYVTGTIAGCILTKLHFNSKKESPSPTSYELLPFWIGLGLSQLCMTYFDGQTKLADKLVKTIESAIKNKSDEQKTLEIVLKAIADLKTNLKAGSTSPSKWDGMLESTTLSLKNLQILD